MFLDIRQTEAEQHEVRIHKMTATYLYQRLKANFVSNHFVFIINHCIINRNRE